MNRVTSSAGRPVAVAIVFLCLMALTFCQILGPMARFNSNLGLGDLAEPLFVATSERASSTHTAAPSHCAAIKIAPIEIRTADFVPAEALCELISAYTTITPHSAELGVPTPPPRQA
jgi:hypothetical protein